MISKAKKILTRNLLNIPGWNTRRKIVVIESDDWGSIRMDSPEAYRHFLNIGYAVDKCPYNRFDMLESNTDMEMLFEVLDSVKDIHGRPAMLTANSLVANPDFMKIEADNFQHYHYEIFTETLKRYPNHDRVFNLYHQGIEGQVIRPQYHGREHLNVSRWMKALQQKDEHALEAFRYNMFSVHHKQNNENILEYMEALDIDNKEQLHDLSRMLKDGADIFEQLWGYPSASFIASCYVWPSEIEKTLLETGVNYIQGVVAQGVPVPGKKFRYSYKYHFQGSRNANGQRYIVRNAFFEPSHTPLEDNVGMCMQRVETSFKWNKPAVISTHRLNFMGGLDASNRERGLTQLESLLKQIVKRWPTVEFMSTDELGNVMKSGRP